MQNDYLAHYGVLGMRWGVRHDKEYKATKRGIIDEYHRTTDAVDRRSDAGYSAAKSKYKEAKKGASLRDKRAAKKDFKAETKRLNEELHAGYNKADEKYKNSINEAKVKTANRLYRNHSAESNRLTQTQSTGKTLLKTALMGSYGSLKYNDVRGQKVDRWSAYSAGTSWYALNNLSFRTLGLSDYGMSRALRPRKKKK